MTPKTRIDIPQVLEDLAYLLGEAHPANPDVRVPVSSLKLASYLDVPRTTLVGWMDGSDPGLHNGLMIIGLWVRLTGKAETFLPRERVTFSAAKMR